MKRGNATVGNAPTGESFALQGGGQAWAGLADDPFFFDLQALNDQVKHAGGSRTFCDAGKTDFFAGFNVSAIVLEASPTRIVVAPVPTPVAAGGRPILLPVLVAIVVLAILAAVLYLTVL